MISNRKLKVIAMMLFITGTMLSGNLFAGENYCFVLIDEKFNLTHTSSILDKNLKKDTSSYWKFTGRKKSRFSQKIKGKKKWQRRDSTYTCKGNTIYFSNDESIKIVRYADNKMVFKTESGTSKYYYVDME